MDTKKKKRLVAAGWRMGDRTVSIDLLMHALVCLGMPRQQLARVLAPTAA